MTGRWRLVDLLIVLWLILFERKAPPVDPYTLGTKMLGSDAKVVEDETILTADQATDATDHSNVVDDLKANGQFVLITGTPPVGQLFTLSADGTAVVLTPTRVASAPTP